ncbi:MAG: IS110 family transposase [Candidatus Xenobiia bacterium LiM19]
MSLKYVGVDIHKRFCQVAELDEKGSYIDEYRIDLCADGLSEFKARIGIDDRLIMEAGGNAFFIASHLKPYVHDVTVVHPAKTRSIGAAKIKTDKSSAKTLAQLLASKFVYPVWIPSIDIQTERALLYHRDALVKERASCKNRVHAILYRRGIIYSGCDLFGKKGREFLKNSLPLCEELERIQIQSLLRLIDTLCSEIESIDRHLVHRFKDNEDLHLLLTIPGVSFVTAVVFLAEIGDIKRFPTPDHLSSYAGLVPRIHQTGMTLRTGGITHAGRSQLRVSLFIAVLILTRRPGKIQDFYQRLLPKGKKVALTACCRKLLVILWKMLMRRKPFRDGDPELSRTKRAHLSRMAEVSPLREVLGEDGETGEE